MTIEKDQDLEQLDLPDRSDLGQIIKSKSKLKVEINFSKNM